MTTLSSTTYDAASPNLARWITVGFIAGAVAVPLYHQVAVALLGALGLTDRAPFMMQPTQPYGVPQFWSLTFWGGVWGVFFAALFTRLYGWRLVFASLLLGALLPMLVAWFVVAPLKGQEMAAGLEPMAMAFGLIVNAAWGLGTGLGLALFGGRAAERRRYGTDRRREERRRSEMAGDYA